MMFKGRKIGRLELRQAWVRERYKGQKGGQQHPHTQDAGASSGGARGVTQGPDFVYFAALPKAVAENVPGPLKIIQASRKHKPM